jgi:trehalose 6-phosphate synthase
MEHDTITPKIDLGGRRLVICSNREPYTVEKRGKDYEFEGTKGGLASALTPIMRSAHGLWVSWGGSSQDAKEALPERQTVPAEEPKFTQERVFLTEEQVNDFYYGFSNQALWPLCHYFLGRCHFVDQHWKAYQEVNELYAEKIANLANPDEDIIWLQDYHMALVGRMLRERKPDLTTGLFWHIPFPAPDFFVFLPWGSQILDGLLGNDVIAFHTPGHCVNFGRSAERLIGCEWDEANLRIKHKGRTVRLLPRGIGVNFDYFNALGSSDEVRARAKEIKEEVGVEKLVLGVDRLDYSKGIKERLLAIERLLENHPEHIGKVSILQIAVPSRTDITEYEEMVASVNYEVGRINGRFSREGWVPIHYYFYGFPQEELAAYYVAADVALITPIVDGMNLVAKEFVAARADRDGVLILSEFAGTALEFSEMAAGVNPFNVSQTSEALHSALTMEKSDRQHVMDHMRERVQRHDLGWWVAENINAIVSRS